jgi:N-acetyl-anhydromuramyl-L-alanine amidase AmpD
VRRGIALVALLGSCGGEPGDWEPAKYFTPGSRSKEIDTIVIHTTEGSYDSKLSFAENQANAYRNTVKYFKDPDRKVSAHFVIGPKGEVTRMVREQDVAWHATYYNSRSLGIECAGWSGRAETWTPELVEALADLVARLAKRYSIEPVHPEGTALTTGGYFTEKGIIGHYQVQTPGSKAVEKYSERTDPGPHFPWAEFMSRLRSKLN